jgi:hypothetical protein
VVLIIPLGLTAEEIMIYAMRTESRALIQAEHAFRDACARLGLDPNEFSTARRIKSPGETFGFLWERKSGDGQIVAMTTYFPHGAEAWSFRGNEGAKFEPY